MNRDVVIDATSYGEEVGIPGLGKFYGRYIKGKKIKKTGIVWMQGKEYIIPDRFNLGFNPSERANRLVNRLIEKTKEPEKK